MSNFAVTLDEYEFVNLLHALTTHPCLNSGDWYMQVRHQLAGLASEFGLNQAPNPLYCQRNGGHGAPALASASATTRPVCRGCGPDSATGEDIDVHPDCPAHNEPTGQWAAYGLDDGDDADPWA